MGIKLESYTGQVDGLTEKRDGLEGEKLVLEGNDPFWQGLDTLSSGLDTDVLEQTDIFRQAMDEGSNLLTNELEENRAQREAVSENILQELQFLNETDDLAVQMENLGQRDAAWRIKHACENQRRQWQELLRQLGAENDPAFYAPGGMGTIEGFSWQDTYDEDDPRQEYKIGSGSPAQRYARLKVMQDSIQWAAGLTPEQREAVWDYSETGYIYINNYLRKKEDSISPYYQVQTDHLHNALKNQRLGQRLTLYRGLNNDFLNDYKGLTNEELVGKIFSDRAFVSTSLLKEDCFGDRPVLLEIDVPPRARGAYIGRLSGLGHRESEVLLDKEQVFRVDSARWENGQRVLKVTLLERQ